MEAWTRFASAMHKVPSVPHLEIQRRVEGERARAAQNPYKRGPKREPKLPLTSARRNALQSGSVSN